MKKISKEEACKFANAITNIGGRPVDESFIKEVVEPYLNDQITEEEMKQIVLKRAENRKNSVKDISDIINNMDIVIYFTYLYSGNLESYCSQDIRDNYILLVYKNEVKPYDDINKKVLSKFDITKEVYDNLVNTEFYFVGELEDNSEGSLCLIDKLYNDITTALFYNEEKEFYEDKY